MLTKRRGYAKPLHENTTLPFHERTLGKARLFTGKKTGDLILFPKPSITSMSYRSLLQLIRLSFWLGSRAGVL